MRCRRAGQLRDISWRMQIEVTCRRGKGGATKRGRDWDCDDLGLPATRRADGGSEPGRRSIEITVYSGERSCHRANPSDCQTLPRTRIGTTRRIHAQTPRGSEDQTPRSRDASGHRPPDGARFRQARTRRASLGGARLGIPRAFICNLGWQITENDTKSSGDEGSNLSLEADASFTSSAPWRGEKPVASRHSNIRPLSDTGSRSQARRHPDEDDFWRLWP